MKITPALQSYQRVNNGMRERPAIPRSSDTVYDHHAQNPPIPRSGSLLESLMKGENLAVAPKSLADYEDAIKGKLASALNKLGIELADDEVVELTIGADNLIRVSGLKDPDAASALEKEMNTVSKVSLTGKSPSENVTKNVYDRGFYIHSDYARSAGSFEEMEQRASLIDLKHRAADMVKSQTGIDLDFSALYLTEDGRIGGYPPELAWIFNGNYSKAPLTDAEKQQYSIATAVLDVVGRLVNAGYDTIPDVGSLGTVFRFGRDDLYANSIRTSA